MSLLTAIDLRQLEQGSMKIPRDSINDQRLFYNGGGLLGASLLCRRYVRNHNRHTAFRREPHDLAIRLVPATTGFREN